jgi:hypothetical protein
MNLTRRRLSAGTSSVEDDIYVHAVLLLQIHHGASQQRCFQDGCCRQTIIAKRLASSLKPQYPRIKLMAVL